VHRGRAEVDAIGIGSETVLVDDPLLTARHVSRTRPLARVIFDRRLRTPPAARIFSTLDAGPVIIVTDEFHIAAQADQADALRRAGAELLEAAGDFAEALGRLAEHSITTLLLEGGRVLHEAALRARVVDRVHVYIAPAVLGAPAVPWVSDPRWSIASLQDLRVEVCGPDVFIAGYVHRID
jgi:diaminohydroxyphosphoribosylaminopyrimidine deaminase/5-amino-6-(5-phosphoribosylamino)uracil reductase